MPMIQLTMPMGVLDESARSAVRRALAATLLKWEGAPDTAFFRSQAWSKIDETPGGAGGQVVRFTELAKLAAAERADA
jgi:hypothetical protein